MSVGKKPPEHTLQHTQCNWITNCCAIVRRSRGQPNTPWNMPCHLTHLTDAYQVESHLTFAPFTSLVLKRPDQVRGHAGRHPPYVIPSRCSTRGDAFVQVQCYLILCFPSVACRGHTWNYAGVTALVIDLWDKQRVLFVAFRHSAVTSSTNTRGTMSSDSCILKNHTSFIILCFVWLGSRLI